MTEKFKSRSEERKGSEEVVSWCFFGLSADVEVVTVGAEGAALWVFGAASNEAGTST